MNIHKIYAQIFKVWRVKRMMKYEESIQPQADEVLLDVGGYPNTWLSRPQLCKSIECMNIHEVDWDPESAPGHNITTLVGDGCKLEYGDNQYDILFSNSVIEHVGTWEQQQSFAKEVRRVGKKIWIQTPAFECPIEPHYLAVGVHWLPIFIRRRILRWFTPWGWMTKPDQAGVDENIAYTSLLSRRQMGILFPDCTIVTERLLGIIPKSYIAYKLEK